MQHSSPSNSSSSSSSSSSSDTSSLENQKALGQELARVLLEELNPDSLPNPQASWREELYEIIEKANESKKTKKASSVKLIAGNDTILPERGGVIDFQTKSKKKLPKHVFAPMVAADSERPVELFCLSYGGFVPEGDTLIEHAYPHTKIRGNQVRLLNFLNDSKNETIANAFLEYPKIDDYIRREDGKVKASLLFFKHSYGAMTNLYLMSQGENSKKGAKDMLKWIEDEGNPMLGEPFLKLVKERGGSHAGILFDRVYQIQSGYREISLNTNSSESIILPPFKAQAKGLGEVVRDWITKIGWAIELHQVQHNQSKQPFKQHVEALLGHFSDDSIEKDEMQDRIRREQIKLMRELKGFFSIQQKILETSQVRVQTSSTISHGSSTGSSSELGAHNKENIENNFQETTQINSITHRIRSVAKISDPALAKPVYQFIEEDLRKRSEARLLKPENWQSILDEFQEYVCKIELSNSKAEKPKSGKAEIGEETKLVATPEQINSKIEKLFSQKVLELDFTKRLQQQTKNEVMAEKEEEIKETDEQMQEIEMHAKTCGKQIAEIKEEIKSLSEKMLTEALNGNVQKARELKAKHDALLEKLENPQELLSKISDTSRKRKREGNSQSSTSASMSHASPKISGNTQSLFATGTSPTLSVIPQMSSSSPPQDSEDGDISIEEGSSIFGEDPSSAAIGISDDAQQPPTKKVKKEKEEEEKDKDEVMPSVTPAPGISGK